MSARFARDDERVVVIVGSGAAGATLAAELGHAGIDVVCLEAGGAVAIEQDLPTMYGRVGWNETRTVTGDLDAGLPLFHARTRGGTTMVWGGVALRLQAHEFSARSTYGALAGTSLADWPLTAADLAPWYARAEQRLGVTGLHGEPFLPRHNNAELLQIGARRRGYHAVSNGHLAINATARDGRPACRQFGFCAGGCVIGAKWSALHAEIPRALASGHVEFREHAQALAIEHDDAGRAQAVVYVDGDGVRQRQRASAVCVAANGIETPRLLLLSASGRFPHGLANGAGQVGRHYMTDLLGRIIAIMPGPVHNYRGSTYTGLVADPMPHDPARGFAGGYLYASRGIHFPLFVNEARADGWGADYAAVMEAYPNMASAAFLGEDMPVADNRVTLDAAHPDAYGNPRAHVTKHFHPNDHALTAHALAAGAEMFRAVGAEQVFTRQSTVAIHHLGTCRQSADPADGVVDAYGRAHEVPNLYVSDGSQFVTSGAAPPTLTVVALALRQAAHLVARLRHGTT